MDPGSDTKPVPGVANYVAWFADSIDPGTGSESEESQPAQTDLKKLSNYNGTTGHVACVVRYTPSQIPTFCYWHQRS